MPPATDSGGLQTAENLPQVTRAMNFRVTARDNRDFGGGVNSDAVRIEVDGGKGPFAVTEPDSSATWTGGAQQVVSWSVNNTESLAANVRITLSTDGGKTFPHVLAESAPNTGSKEITVPRLETQSARIKVAAIGNVFFDISDADFTITAGAVCSYSINPISESFVASGGAETVDVTTGAECSWTAASNAPWITIVAGDSCTGNGTVGYFVAANTGGQRTGMMTIAGQTFTVMQAAASGGSSGLQYYPLPSPVRLLDTRPGETGCFTPGAPLGNDAVRLQPATGACTSIPASAKAIVGNATVVNFISTGFHWITLYPSDAAQPTASNLNFSDNQIIPNQFTVGLGADGAFKIYSHAATHFIVDITGYYAPPGTGGLYYHPLPAPVRLLDTRPGETACDAPGAPLADNGTKTVLAHRTCLGATIPSTAKAIVGNATVVNFISSGSHWITLYPFGAALPNASNLNFTANQVIANAFVVGLSSDGKFNIYSHASTHFIVDVNGYFSDEAADVNGQGLLYNALPTPVRLLDTRPGEIGCDAPGVPLGDNATRTQTAHRTCFGVTIPSTAKAVVGNATVVNFISSGFHWITLYPFGVAAPNASNINFSANQIIPNAFVVGLSSAGKFNIYSHGSTHFIVDLNGYFAP